MINYRAQPRQPLSSTRTDYSHTTFEGMSFRDGVFPGCTFEGTNLRTCDLAHCDFTDADLTYADLTDANVLQTEFAGAWVKDTTFPHRDITPVIPRIHQTMLAAIKANPHGFNMSHWHATVEDEDDEEGEACHTTHCRAGWVVFLAGEAGRALERLIGTGAAAALIYAASDPMLDRIPNWYDDEEGALEDMEICAAIERAREAAHA